MPRPTDRFYPFTLQIFRMIALLGCLLLQSFLFRIAFLLHYGAHTGWQSFREDLPPGLFMGLRLDVQVTLYFLIPLLLLALGSFLFKDQRCERIARIWSLALGCFFSLFLLTDFFYYRYFGTHFSISVFGIVDDDARAVLQSVWEDYPLVAILSSGLILTALIASLILGIYRSSALRKLSSYRLPGRAALLVFPLAALLMRGSTGTFPLRNHDALVSKNNFINTVCLNPFLCLKEAYKSYAATGNFRPIDDMLREAGYASASEAVADYLNLPPDSITGDPLAHLLCVTPVDSFLAEHPPHVIFLQMESMGVNGLSLQNDRLNVWGKLKDELTHCIYYEHFLPYTSESTIGSLEGILVSNPFGYLTQSRMENRPLPASVARPFKKAGYETRFVTGAKQGWRNLHTFLPLQGFDFVEGRETILHDIPETEIQDWGVFDEYMFRQILHDLQQASAPQFVYGMSITNHSPHQLPRGYVPEEINLDEALKQRLLGNEEYTRKGLSTFRYANDCLADFIHTLRHSPWAEHVIVAVSGDHPFKGFLKARQGQPYDTYGVPLILYIPDRYRKNKTIHPRQRGSHRDIFPTLFHLSLSNASYYNLGNNMLGNDTINRTAFAPSHLLIDDSCAVDLQMKHCYGNIGDSVFVMHDNPQAANPLIHRYHAWMTVLNYVLLRSLSGESL